MSDSKIDLINSIRQNVDSIKPYAIYHMNPLMGDNLKALLEETLALIDALKEQEKKQDPPYFFDI